MDRVKLSLGVVFILLLAGCVTLSEADRRKVVAHRDLGAMYLQRGQPELAIRELRKGLAIWERDAQTHFSLGEAYRQKNEFEDSERHFRRALALDPELLDARLNLGALYLQNERWRDAIRENELLLDDPTFLRPSRALVNLGWAYYKSGDLERAKDLFREALTGDPGNLQASLDLAIVLYDVGELVESVRQFNQVLSLLEGRPEKLFGVAESETRFRLAMAHVRLGQRDKALEQLRVAVERGGETEWGRKSREYLAVLQ